MTPTEVSYRKIIAYCQELFEKKTKDYGTSWRILRLPSLTDQLFIKAKRIRSIQEKGTQKIADDIATEFVGIINYSIMALMQLEWANDPRLDIPLHELKAAYQKKVDETFSLLMAKNHDYGEAWRDMRITSITDIILMKLLRIKQIEENQGKTLVSEGVMPNYQDIINYAVFALILLKFDEQLLGV